jgi:hypothetical protein
MDLSTSPQFPKALRAVCALPVASAAATASSPQQILACSACHGFTNPCGYPGMGRAGMGTGDPNGTRRKPTPGPRVWQVFKLN